MFNLFKYIILFIIIYFIIQFLQKLIQKVKNINPHVKGKSKNSDKQWIFLKNTPTGTNLII